MLSTAMTMSIKHFSLNY